MAKYRLIRVNEEEEAFNGCLISLVVIGIVLYGIYTAGVFLMELLVYPFFLPNETDMSETYYTKIVVNETVPYLNTQLGEYLQSKGFSSDTNSPKLYKNIREGGRDKIDKVKYLGKGNYKRGFCISPIQVIHRSILALKIKRNSKFWQSL